VTLSSVWGGLEDLSLPVKRISTLEVNLNLLEDMNIDKTSLVAFEHLERQIVTLRNMRHALENNTFNESMISFLDPSVLTRVPSLENFAIYNKDDIYKTVHSALESMSNQSSGLLTRFFDPFAKVVSTASGVMGGLSGVIISYGVKALGFSPQFAAISSAISVASMVVNGVNIARQVSNYVGMAQDAAATVDTDPEAAEAKIAKIENNMNGVDEANKGKKELKNGSEVSSSVRSAQDATKAAKSTTDKIKDVASNVESQLKKVDDGDGKDKDKKRSLFKRILNILENAFKKVKGVFASAGRFVLKMYNWVKSKVTKSNLSPEDQTVEAKIDSIK